MKKIILIICLLGIFLMAAVTSLKWRQISDVTTTLTEINFVHGLTSSIQTQLNGKINTADADARYLQIANGDTADYLSATETQTKIDSIGGFIPENKLQFIVGVTGGATTKNGDSILTLTSIINRRVDVYRNGLKLYQNATATNGQLGYRFNSVTGQIVFRPVLATNDKVIIEDQNINNWTNQYLPQNFFRYSGDLTTSTEYWLPNSGTLTDANSGIDLDGQYTLDKFTGTASDSRFMYYYGGTELVTTPSTEYILSFDIIKGTLPNLIAYIYNTTGSSVIYNSSYLTQVSTGNVTRVTITFTTPVGCIKTRIYPIYGGGIGYAWFGRMNVSSNGFGSNYVLTTTTQKN